uniref:Uncharacterized protein n=1 Tax=Oryza sativa subsp. japonica TaxID=39947 RepID=Q6EQF3_ORYSJ|nr:hypothetical protein [Oryza sativa Japonica Group]BAD29117.1 hypothetical protein [Oryza sativa Japonica Group]
MSAGSDSMSDHSSYSSIPVVAHIRRLHLGARTFRRQLCLGCRHSTYPLALGNAGLK